MYNINLIQIVIKLLLPILEYIQVSTLMMEVDGSSHYVIFSVIFMMF